MCVSAGGEQGVGDTGSEMGPLGTTGQAQSGNCPQAPTPGPVSATQPETGPNVQKWVCPLLLGQTAATALGALGIFGGEFGSLGFSTPVFCLAPL